MVTAVTTGTPAVVTGKDALVAPAATVTLAGTVAAPVLLLESATEEPPAGAAPLRVTIPVEVPPPTTVAGLSVTEARLGGSKDREAVRVTPPLDAESVAVAATTTGLVVTWKVAVVEPAATVTLIGAVNDPLSSRRATASPPVGAAAVSVTVPVALDPPTTSAGMMVTEESAAEGGVVDPGV
jgi:hypothetical protein